MWTHDCSEILRKGWMQSWKKFEEEKVFTHPIFQLKEGAKNDDPIVLVGTGRDEGVFLEEICARFDRLGESLEELGEGEGFKDVWRGAQKRYKVLDGVLESLKALVKREERVILGGFMRR